MKLKYCGGEIPLLKAKRCVEVKAVSNANNLHLHICYCEIRISSLLRDLKSGEFRCGNPGYRTHSMYLDMRLLRHRYQILLLVEIHIHTQALVVLLLMRSVFLRAVRIPGCCECPKENSIQIKTPIAHPSSGGRTRKGSTTFVTVLEWVERVQSRVDGLASHTANTAVSDIYKKININKHTIILDF